MSDGTVSIDIVANFNTETLEKVSKYITEAKDDLGTISRGLSESMKDMDAPARLLSEQLEKCKTTADQVSQRVQESEKVLNSKSATAEEKSLYALRLQNAFDDLKTMKSMLSGEDFGHEFSVKLAQQMFSGLPQAIQREVNLIAPQLTGTIRRMFNGLNADNPKIGTSLPALTEQVMKDASVQKMLSTVNASAEQKQNVVRALVAAIRPLQYTKEYQLERFGSLAQGQTKLKRVEDILPELYKGAYKNKGYTYQRVDERTKAGKQVLDAIAVDKLYEAVSENNVVAKAAELSGVASRDKEGKLHINGDITRNKLGAMSQALWKEYQTRTTGLVDKLDFYGKNITTSDQRKDIEERILNRSFSGTGSSALLGMHVVSDLIKKANFIDRNAETAKQRLVEDEEKRLKEQYVVEKISPFNKNESMKRVSIGESAITRMLGLQGHNYEDTDAIKIISLNGYDEKNPEHKKYIRDLRTKGYTDDSGHYILHTMHGTGQDATARLIRETDANRIRKTYAPIARTLGLAGDDVLNAFVPVNYEFKDAQGFGKHIDQLNKMWTDTYLYGSDLSNKKFAIVDFTDENGVERSNGLGYATRGVISNGSQIRMALSGKGSLVTVDYDTIGDWARAAGKADAQGRYMVKGIDGTMFDASDYHVLYDKSMIKNLLAYEGMNNEQANNAATELSRLFGLGVVSDYKYDDKAEGLGSQMTAFMAMSPNMMMHQAKNLILRMRELETLEGMRKYIFNSPNKDFLSKLANDPEFGDVNMLSDDAFKKREDIYKDALMRSVSSGELINFEEIAEIKNQRLLRNPLMADTLTRGGLTSTEITKYRNILENAHNRTFSDEEIRDLIELREGGVDFAHIDSDQFAAIRSPTGLGQMIVRKNYAKLLEPIYNAYHMDKTGIHLNDTDYKVMAGADMDADMAKVIVSKINDDNIDIVQEIKAYSDYIQAEKQKIQKEELKIKQLPPVSGKNTIDNPENWERTAALSISAPQGMGFMSAVDSRLAQLGIGSDIGRYIIKTSMMANEGYDAETTKVKKPVDVVKNSRLWEAIELGQEFEKVTSKLENMYNVVEAVDENGNTIYTTLDRKTTINPSNVLKATSGRLINLEYLQGPDGTRLDRTNAPSVLKDSAVAARTVAAWMNEHQYQDYSITQDLLEAMGVEGNGGVGYNGAGPETQRLMKNKRAILAQFAGLTRTKIDPEELKVLASQYAASMQEINEDALNRERAGGHKGFVKLDDNSYVKLSDYVESQINKYGLHTVENMLGSKEFGKDLVGFGFTQENIRRRFGDKVADIFKNAQNVSMPDATYAKVAPAYQHYAKYYSIGDTEPTFVDAANMQETANVTIEQQNQKGKIYKGKSKRRNKNTIIDQQQQNNVPQQEFDYEKLTTAFVTGNVQMVDKMLKSEDSRQAALGMQNEMKELHQRFNKDIFNNPDRTQADKWFGINRNTLDNLNTMLEYASTHGDASVFGSNALLGNQLYQANGALNVAYLSARNAYIKKSTADRLERFNKMVDGRGDKADAQAEMIEAWDKEIKEQHGLQKAALKDYETKVDPTAEGKTEQLARIKEMSSALKEMQQKRDEGITRLINENVQMFEDIGAQFDQLVNGKDRSLQKKIDVSKDTAITKVSDSLKLLESFKDKALIPDDFYQKMKSEYEQYLKDVQSGAFETRLISERRKQLGMDKQTPTQEAQEWLNQRLEVLDAQEKKKAELETEANAAYANLNNTGGNAQIAAELQKKYEEAKKKAEDFNYNPQERAIYQMQAAQMESALYKVQNNKYDDFVRMLTGQHMTPLEQAERRMEDIKERARQNRDRYASETDMYKRWDDIYNNKDDVLDKYKQSVLDDINLMQARQQEQSHYQVEQMLTRGKLNKWQRYGGRDILSRSAQIYYGRQLRAQNEVASLKNQEFQLQQRMKGMDQNSPEYTQAANDLTKVQNALAGANEELNNSTKFTSKASAGFMVLSQSVGMVLQRFGRQLFMKALNEAKRFIQDFDKSMTEIQMITLKTDEEMSHIGEGLIKQAKDLKVSISDITKAASALYRQGLSDSQVNERLSVVAKFSKVAGVDTTAATKLITTAINTGLVKTAQEATDIVTALGDNAATNAAEIQKGIEKAGAAAAADGTTFGQLAAMLTAITSTTQVGGRVAGTTLQTIFGRMNKIGTNELIYDENGNAISGSAISTLLAAQGIKTYENGEKRSTFDVLYELSKKWDSMKDAEQQQIAAAIAGTRQYSNFSAIMQGMAEGNIDEYMALVGESSGITDQKYEQYVDSLEASLINFKNTFDSLIKDLSSSGFATSIIDVISKIIQGIDNITNSMGGLAGVLAALLPIVGAMMVIHSGGNWAVMGAGLALLAASSIYNAIRGGSQQQQTSQERYDEVKSQYNDMYKSTANDVNRMKELRDKGDNRTKAESEVYEQLLSKYEKYAEASGGGSSSGLVNTADEVSNALGDVDDALVEVSESAQEAASTMSRSADQIIDAAENKLKEWNLKEFLGTKTYAAQAAEESLLNAYATTIINDKNRVDNKNNDLYELYDVLLTYYNNYGNNVASVMNGEKGTGIINTAIKHGSKIINKGENPGFAHFIQEVFEYAGITLDKIKEQLNEDQLSYIQNMGLKEVYYWLSSYDKKAGGFYNLNSVFSDNNDDFWLYAINMVADKKASEATYEDLARKTLTPTINDLIKDVVSDADERNLITSLIVDSLISSLGAENITAEDISAELTRAVGGYGTTPEQAQQNVQNYIKGHTVQRSGSAILEALGLPDVGESGYYLVDGKQMSREEFLQWEQVQENTVKVVDSNTGDVLFTTDNEKAAGQFIEYNTKNRVIKDQNGNIYNDTVYSAAEHKELSRAVETANQEAKEKYDEEVKLAEQEAKDRAYFSWTNPVNGKSVEAPAKEDILQAQNEYLSTYPYFWINANGEKNVGPLDKANENLGYRPIGLLSFGNYESSLDWANEHTYLKDDNGNIFYVRTSGEFDQTDFEYNETQKEKYYQYQYGGIAGLTSILSKKGASEEEIDKFTDLFKQALDLELSGKRKPFDTAEAFYDWFQHNLPIDLESVANRSVNGYIGMSNLVPASYNASRLYSDKVIEQYTPQKTQDYFSGFGEEFIHEHTFEPDLPELQKWSAGIVDGLQDGVDFAIETITDITQIIKNGNHEIQAIKTIYGRTSKSSYEEWKGEKHHQYDLMADRAIEMITSNDFKNVSELKKYVNENDLQYWGTLEADTDFGRLVETVTDESGKAGINTLLNYLYGKSFSYQDHYVSNKSKSEIAMDAFKRMKAGAYANYEIYKAAYDEYVENATSAGEEVLSIEDWAKRDNKSYIENPDALTYLKEIINDEELYERLIKHDLKTSNDSYIADLITNFANGITGLNDRQKIESANRFVNYMLNPYGDYDSLYTLQGFANSFYSDDELKQRTSAIDGLYDLVKIFSGISHSDAKNIIKGIYSPEAVAHIVSPFGYNYDTFNNLFRSVKKQYSLSPYVNKYNYKDIEALYDSLNSMDAATRLQTLQQAQATSYSASTTAWALSQLDANKTYSQQNSTAMNLLVAASGYSADQIARMWEQSPEDAKQQLQDAVEKQRAKLNENIISAIDALLTGMNLQFGDNATTDEIANAVAETNAELAEYIRTVGYAIVNGQKQVEEGTGTTGYKSLEEVIASDTSASRAEAQAKQDVQEYINNGFSSLKVNGESIQTIAPDWENVDPMLRYMIWARNNGSNVISDQMIQDQFQNWIYGRNMNPFQTSDNMRTLFGDTYGDAEAMMNMYLGWKNPNSETYNEEAVKAFEEIDQYGIGDAFNTESVDKANEAVRDFNETISKESIDYLNKYGDSTEQVSQALDLFSRNTNKAVSANKTFNQSITAISNNQYFRKKFMSGDRSADVVQAVASMLNLSEEVVKDNKNKSLIENLLNMDEQQDLRAVQSYFDSAAEQLTADLTELSKTIDLGQIMTINADGSFTLDTSGLEDSAAAESYAATQRIIQAFIASGGGEVSLKAIDDGNGGLKIVAVVGSLGQGKKSGGGGGGGGKSKIDKLLEKQQRQGKINEHEIKMVQHKEQYYENDSQLGNYGLMIEEENRIRERYQERLKANYEELRKTLASTKKESDDWYKLRDAILAAEEAMEENSNAIEDNKRKLEENHQAILKLHTDLEDMIKQEIETRIQEERAIIEGTASMEQTIVDIIRQRYTDEWDLIKKDIDKKKEALEEEKQLIQERLQARKDAEEEANKYEQLAELQRQLASISMDGSRTKDAMELRKKIAAMQKEIAWDTAEEEAKAAQDGIDEQIEAYDQFVNDGEEALNEFLKNANNFSEEVTRILEMSQEDILNWLKENSEEYKNSLESTQETMVQGWTDTWKQMRGIVDTYWNEINEILSSEDKFIEYMKQSSSYINASEDEREQMEYNWRKMYENWFKAQDISAEYSHDDSWMDSAGTTSSTPQNPSKPTTTPTTDIIGAMAIAGQTVVESVVSPVLSTLGSLLSGLNIPHFAGGGTVDFTGLAWVDGTKTNPESFLDATDTKYLREMLDMFSYVRNPVMSFFDSSTLGGTGNTIDEVNVTINGAEFGDDADYEEIAKRVGQEFAKELEQQGFTTANYNL